MDNSTKPSAQLCFLSDRVRPENAYKNHIRLRWVVFNVGRTKEVQDVLGRLYGGV